MAVSVLHSYLSNTNVMVLRETLRVSAGSRSYVKFNFYELTISVSGDCIGKCDIEIRPLDENYRTIWFFGRVSYLRENLTALLSSEPFHWHLSIEDII